MAGTISRVGAPDGSLRIAALPSPPQAMIMQAGEVGVALGYLMAYVDGDGDGTLTVAHDKPWRWPEFRGGIDRLVYATGPVREGTMLYALVGAHPGGPQLVHVELTAQCEGDSCRGYDKMSLGARPDKLVLVLPAEPASYRFPNLD